MLETVSWIAVTLGVLTALVIALDARRHPQDMKIMNVVWPVTGLYFPVVGLWLYRAIGRSPGGHAHHAKAGWKSTFLSATHCASGCVIGDMVGAPVVFIAGWTLLGSALLADYATEFTLAYLAGIAFQYLPIREMRDVSPGAAIRDAIKADTLSLVAFEVGMFGWMALVRFWLLGHELAPSSIVFWFMLQIGMIAGFATTYPANWLLVKWGVKGGM